MPSPAERLEHARRTLANQGLPVDALGRLAVRRRTVAQLLDCSERTVDNLVSDGDLTPFYVGKDPRFELVELAEFMERKRRVAPDRKPRSKRAKARAVLDGVPR